MSQQHTDVRTRIREEQLENTVSGPIRSPAETLADVPTDVEDGMVFETSGSTGDPKRIPCRNTDALVGSMADAFSLAGLAGDVVLNLGAPLPHVSAWGFRQAVDRLGGRSANQHFRDYEAVIERGEASEVTAVITAPSVGTAIGEEIAAEHGPVPEVFPNVERLLSGADLLTAARRERLRELWGVEAVRETYASTEFNAIAATVDESNAQLPLLHRFVLEVVPDDGSGEILDVREVTEETRGSILITAPDRAPVDFTRYRIGDKVAVEPGPDVPRITVLGREDDSINLSGALLYPAQIHDAVRETYGPDADWVARVSADDYPSVDFHVVGGTAGRADEFRAALFARNGPVEQAYEDVGVIDSLAVHQERSREDVPGLSGSGGMKTRHVVYEDSFAGAGER